jgi:hypothetical protein
VFVGGTGSASPKHAYGSMVDFDSQNVHDMDAVGDNFKAHFIQEHPEKIRELLKATTSTKGVVHGVSGYCALLTCPRMGALAVRWMNAFGLSELRRMKSEATGVAASPEEDDDVWLVAEHLFAVASADIARWFRALNSLESLSAVELQNTLADALAIDMGAYDHILDDKTRVQLVTKYGVLRDRARHVNASDLPVPHYRVLADTSVMDAKPKTEKTVLIVPDDRFGRFEMPLAYRSMYVTACVGQVPGLRGNAEWESLEKIVCLWLAVLQTCVTPERTLHDLVQILCAEHVVRAFPASTFKGTAASAAARTAARDMASAKPAFSRRLAKRGAIATVRAESLATRDKAMATWTVAPDRFPFGEGDSARSRRRNAQRFDPLKILGQDMGAGVTVKNAPGAPYADVAAYSRDRSGTLWTVLTECKMSKDDAIDMERSLVGVGLSAAALARAPKAPKPPKGTTRKFVDPQQKKHVARREYHKQQGGNLHYMMIVVGPMVPQANEFEVASQDGVVCTAALVHFKTRAAGWFVAPTLGDAAKGGDLPPPRARSPLYPFFIETQ